MLPHLLGTWLFTLCLIYFAHGSLLRFSVFKWQSPNIL